MRKALFIIVLILVALPVGGYYFREELIKSIINKAGTLALGTQVAVQQVEFEPFDGLLALHGLSVANPEGYSANNAVEVGTVRVQLVPKSLLSGAIQIKEITVKEPKVRLEGGLKKNNLTALQANFPQPGATAEEKPPVATEQGEGRSVEIDLLQIADGIITITSPIEATANLGTITLKDIGKKGNSTSLADVFPIVLNRIIGAGTAVLTSEIGQKGREALEKVGGEAGGAVKSIGDKLKGFFGR